MTTISKPFLVKDDFIIDNAAGRSFVIPHGTGLERPASPIKGTMRYSDDSEVCEIYNGNEWQNVAQVGESVTQSGAEEIALVQSIIFG
jgi:hypothetical protein